MSDAPSSPAAVPGWVRGRKLVAVLSGAGISTDSGIPDYRGPQGVWTRDPEAEKLVTYDAYMSDPEVRRRSWLARRDHPAHRAQPNVAHRCLVDLERARVALRVVTQNVDGLHQRAGLPGRHVLELHGSMREAVCTACGARGPLAGALERVAAGEPDPRCTRCGGILKSGTVMFGQQLDPAVLAAAAAVARSCDLFLAVGTSLRVEPAASLCRVAYGHGAPVVVVNAEPTPYDGLATAVVREPIAAALPRIAAALAAGRDG